MIISFIDAEWWKVYTNHSHHSIYMLVLIYHKLWNKFRALLLEWAELSVWIYTVKAKMSIYDIFTYRNAVISMFMVCRKKQIRQPDVGLTQVTGKKIGATFSREAISQWKYFHWNQFQNIWNIQILRIIRSVALSPATDRLDATSKNSSRWTRAVGIEQSTTRARFD